MVSIEETVILASLKNLPQQIAVLVLKHGEDPAAFLAEARIFTKAGTHPNLLPFFGMCTDTAGQVRT